MQLIAQYAPFMILFCGMAACIWVFMRVHYIQESALRQQEKLFGRDSKQYNTSPPKG